MPLLEKNSSFFKFHPLLIPLSVSSIRNYEKKKQSPGKLAWGVRYILVLVYF